MRQLHCRLLRGISVPLICIIAVSCVSVAVSADEPAVSSQTDKVAEEAFLNETLPLLKQHCFECHSHAGGKAKGGLVLDSRSGWAKGGDSGPAIIPGNLDESLLIQAVRYGNGTEMPPKGKLPKETIEALERWVKNGAADPRTSEVIKAQTRVDFAAGKKHWAFQPIHEATPSEVKETAWPLKDADRFLLARLEERGLHPAKDADPYTWLRRVSLDLTGLPPTVTEIQAFVRDCDGLKSQSPGELGLPTAARERVVDRLLDSHAFGERWGRHWLDLVGYADQIGTANDIFAEHAWRYRDYVIAAFNSDKPFDRFLREQLAGDLLPFDSIDQRAEQLVATGFLLLGDLTVVEADKPKLRIDVVDQQVDKIGRAFLGMTIGCARCHDHKFDPIAQRDYYAIAGILNSTESIQKAEWGVWSWPTVVELPETEAQQNARLALAERHRQRIDGWKADRDRQRDQKKEVDAALAKPEAAAADEAIRAALTKTQAGLNERLQKLDADILHAEFFLAAPPKAFGVRDIPEPTDMQITIRGNAYALGDKVPRGFLQVVTNGSAPEMRARQSGRLQLADWIASRENPLTARVVVNRMWQKLFGEGLVRSVDYFGLPGEKPSHPELLDHLAQRLMNDSWSQKKLIRGLVLSRAYGMSSEGDKSAVAPPPARCRVSPRFFTRSFRQAD
jgi:mono/diheme cytochrome c family protein